MDPSIKRRAGLTVRDLGSEMILYDRGSETFHVLNGTARRIWLLLDGQDSGQDGSTPLQERYASLFPAEDRGRLDRDLTCAIEEFDRRGLVEKR